MKESTGHNDNLGGRSPSTRQQRILESNDPYFNDIPLAEWNRLDVSVRQLVGRMIRECNGPKAGVSPSDCVCAAKSAARIIKAETMEGEKCT
jgi:hypothetical protein